MSKKGAKDTRVSLDKLGCCKVESLVSIDDRGQMVIPKELRNTAKIMAGDKLALVSVSCGGGSSAPCIFLIKAEALAGLLKDILGPMARETLKR